MVAAAADGYSVRHRHAIVKLHDQQGKSIQCRPVCSTSAIDSSYPRHVRVIRHVAASYKISPFHHATVCWLVLSKMLME